MRSGKRPRVERGHESAPFAPRPLARSHVIIDQIDQMCHKSLTSCYRPDVSDDEEDSWVLGVPAGADPGAPGERGLHPPALGQTLPSLPTDRHRPRLEGRSDLHSNKVSTCGEGGRDGLTAILSYLQLTTTMPTPSSQSTRAKSPTLVWKIDHIFTATRSI